MAISEDMDQITARQYAKVLTEGTGSVHVAVTVPVGSWGGHERAWAVDGPHADLANNFPPEEVKDVEGTR